MGTEVNASGPDRLPLARSRAGDGFQEREHLGSVRRARGRHARAPCWVKPSSSGTSTGSAEPFGKSPPSCRFRFGRIGGTHWIDVFGGPEWVSPSGRNAASIDSEPSDFLFEDRGITHLDVSLRTTLLPVPAGPFTASLTIDAHWVRGLDTETKRTGVRVGEPARPDSVVVGPGAPFHVPRCRPERELCQDL